MIALFEQFLKERTYIKNVSKNTLIFYRASFRAYQKIIGSATVPAKQDLNNFVIGLREEGSKPVTCNTYIRGMNSFLTWLHENEHTTEHLKIKQLKCEQRVIQTFSNAELQRIISFKPKGFYELRIHVLVLLAIDTG